MIQQPKKQKKGRERGMEDFSRFAPREKKKKGDRFLGGAK